MEVFSNSGDMKNSLYKIVSLVNTTALHFTSQQCTTMNFIVLCCTDLQGIAFHCTATKLTLQDYSIQLYMFLYGLIKMSFLAFLTYFDLLLLKKKLNNFGNFSLMFCYYTWKAHIYILKPMTKYIDSRLFWQWIQFLKYSKLLHSYIGRQRQAQNTQKKYFLMLVKYINIYF